MFPVCYTCNTSATVTSAIKATYLLTYLLYWLIMSVTQQDNDSDKLWQLTLTMTLTMTMTWKLTLTTTLLTIVVAELLQAGCPSCRATNSVKALKDESYLTAFYHFNCTSINTVSHLIAYCVSYRDHRSSHKKLHTSRLAESRALDSEEAASGLTGGRTTNGAFSAAAEASLTASLPATSSLGIDNCGTGSSSSA